MDKEKTLRKLKQEIAEVREKFGVEYVEVKHRQWKSLGCGEFVCSECNSYYDYESCECCYNYCPNCGAKMDGGADHEN